MSGRSLRKVSGRGFPVNLQPCAQYMDLSDVAAERWRLVRFFIVGGGFGVAAKAVVMAAATAAVVVAAAAAATAAATATAAKATVVYVTAAKRMQYSQRRWRAVSGRV